MTYLGRIRTGWKKSSPLVKGLILTVSTIVVLIASFLAINIARIYDRNKDYNTGTLRGIPIEEVINKVKSSESIRYERFYIADEGLDYPETLPIDWSWQFNENRSHNFYLHSWDNLNKDLISFDEEKDIKQLQRSVDTVIDWINSNDAEYANNQEGNFAWYDMAVGVRAYRLAYILDQSIRENEASEQEISLMWQSLVDHLEYLQDEGNIIFHNNHGVFQAIGQKAVARRLYKIDEKQFAKINEEASSRLEKMLSEQFTDEGIHKEHSPSYHQLVYQLFLKIKSEGLLESDEMNRTLAKVGDALYWMIKPNDYLVNFGDTDYRYVPRDPDRFYDESSSHLRYFATSGAFGFLPTNNLACFDKSGFVSVKQGVSYLAQQGAFHSRTHKHADDLTIAWYDKGQDLLIDSGKYGFPERTKAESDEYRQGFWYADEKRIYIEKTRAHNTIEVDDSDQDRVNREPYGSAIKQCGQTDNGVYFVESEVEYTGGIRHSRLLFFKPGEWLIVTDRLDPTGTDNHNYKQWFHLAENLELSRDGDAFMAADKGLEEELHITDLLYGKTETIGPIVGQTEPHLQGWYSPDANVFEPSPAIAFEKNQSGATTFATLLAFSDDNVQISGDNSFNNNIGNFTWEEDGRTHLLRYSFTGNGEIRVEFIER